VIGVSEEDTRERWGSDEMSDKKEREREREERKPAKRDRRATHAPHHHEANSRPPDRTAVVLSCALFSLVAESLSRLSSDATGGKAVRGKTPFSSVSKQRERERERESVLTIDHP
jgi:hypothetical protein